MSSKFDPAITLSELTGRPTEYRFKDSINGGRPIPADDIVQVFNPEREFDGRGVPWFTDIHEHLNLLYLLETGHLKNAIRLARIPGYTKLPTRMYNALLGEIETGADVDWESITERVSQQVIPTSPEGTAYLPQDGSWEKIDSALNPAEFLNLRRGTIAGIAVGWGINYNTVASDLAGINFTTGRMAKLEDETLYLELREWMQSVIIEIFNHWAARTFQLLESTLVYKWNVREYKYLDPQKQSSSDKIALANGTTSRRRIAMRDGNDIDEILDELAEEQQRINEIQGGDNAGQAEENDSDRADGNDSGNGRGNTRRGNSVSERNNGRESALSARR